MSNVFLTINIFLITILIPIVIAIFHEERDFKILDKNLIFGYIIRAKVFLFYFILLFVPFIFWYAGNFIVT